MAFINQPGPRRGSCGGAGKMILLAGLLTPILAGCGTNRIEPATHSINVDARSKHPIALTEGVYTVDLFPTGTTLDRRSQEQVADFAQRYRTLGHGPISILTPAGGPAASSGQTTVSGIRTELARNGAMAHVAVSSYPVADPQLAAPVRLSFGGMRAKVTHRCGDWPSDLASGSTVRGWDNQPYWNFGCANQNMIATQVADPRDIAQPRGETPADMQMRMRGVTRVRAGQDPGTSWKVQNTSIGSVGG